MNNQIKTYKDLLDEKERLKSLLQAQKEIIHGDIRELKEELAPVRSAISMAGKLITKDTGGNLVLRAGANTVIDLVVKKLILGRSGWLIRNVVPLLLKNYSSHVIADNKGSLLKKLFAWMGKKNSNGQVPTHN